MQRFTSRAALSLAAASMCFLSIPVAMARGGDAPTAMPARIRSCAYLDPSIFEPVAVVDGTSDATDPTDTTVDPAFGDSRDSLETTETTD